MHTCSSGAWFREFFCWRSWSLVDQSPGIGQKTSFPARQASSNQPPVIQSTLFPSFVLLFFRKRIPKPKCFISRTRHNRLPIRTHS